MALACFACRSHAPSCNIPTHGAERKRSLRFELSVQRGLPRDLHYTLMKGDGMDPRSTASAPSDRSRG